MPQYKVTVEQLEPPGPDRYVNGKTIYTQVVDELNITAVIDAVNIHNRKPSPELPGKVVKQPFPSSIDPVLESNS